MRAVVLGNCQAAGLAAALRALSPNLEVDDRSVGDIDFTDDAQVDRLIADLSAYDLALVQSIGGPARPQLADTIDAVMSLAIDKKDVRVNLTCGAAGIALSAINREGERGESYVPWAIADTADIALEVGFRHHLVTEARRAFNGENVFLHLPPDDHGALFITDDSDGSREAVIMPLRA